MSFKVPYNTPPLEPRHVPRQLQLPRAYLPVTLNVLKRSLDAMCPAPTAPVLGQRHCLQTHTGFLVDGSTPVKPHDCHLSKLTGWY